jgi:hypothetical protein
VLQKLKSAYLIWYGFYNGLPKTHRYSLGQRIDTLFVEIMEAVALASFLPRQEKQPYVRLSIRKYRTFGADGGNRKDAWRLERPAIKTKLPRHHNEGEMTVVATTAAGLLEFQSLSSQL